MIQAKHTYAGYRLARLYDGYLLGRAFRDIRIEGRAQEKGLPRLLLANHFCWWDGFIQSRLNRCCLNRNLYVMMLEEQLRRFPLLASMGAFSVRPGSRSVIESLRYAARLLEDARNMVLIFPQGRIQSAHTEYFRFGSGTDYLLKCLRNPVQILFNVNLADYYSRRRPALNVYFTEAGSVIREERLSPGFTNIFPPGAILPRPCAIKESGWNGKDWNEEEGKEKNWNRNKRDNKRWNGNESNDEGWTRNEWNRNERDKIEWNGNKSNDEGRSEGREDGFEQDGFKQKKFKQDGIKPDRLRQNRFPENGPFHPERNNASDVLEKETKRQKPAGIQPNQAPDCKINTRTKPVPVPSPLETEFNRFAARCRALQDHRYR